MQQIAPLTSPARKVGARISVTRRSSPQFTGDMGGTRFDVVGSPLRAGAD
ncbi:hypothetical protein GCM10009775_25540 [Microbacterium aoyamense]|uniref:Uncharacterized protein n=1 Tax=Microbacterium aoyamense TaxID=344166 RepID=A0ABP5B5M8_9MICO